MNHTSNNTDNMNSLALCSAFQHKALCSFNLCVYDLLLPTTKKQPHVERNVTVMKEFTAEFYYDSASLQFMKLQAADYTLTSQRRYVVQSQVKSMICVIFEI